VYPHLNRGISTQACRRFFREKPKPIFTNRSMICNQSGNALERPKCFSQAAFRISWMNRLIIIIVAFFSAELP